MTYDEDKYWTELDRACELNIQLGEELETLRQREANLRVALERVVTEHGSWRAEVTAYHESGSFSSVVAAEYRVNLAVALARIILKETETET